MVLLVDLKILQKFSKISKLLIDTFDSKDDINFSLKNFHFQNMQDQVSDDFINDEVYEIKDKESGEIKYKLKCNTLIKWQLIMVHSCRFHLVCLLFLILESLFVMLLDIRGLEPARKYNLD